MGIIQERAKTKELLPTGPSASGDTTVTHISDEQQDYDLEERGMHRTDTQPRHGQSSEDIELQDIPLSSPDGTVQAVEENHELNELLAEPADSSQIIDASAHPLDPFSSGESVIMDMQFIKAIKYQWHSTGTTGSIEPSGYVSSHSYRNALFEARFRAGITPNNRNTGSV